MKRPVSKLLLLLGSLTLFFEGQLFNQPTFKDVSYGRFEDNKLDFWAARAKGPRPLVIFIHGGGWTTGSKTQRLPDVDFFLRRGISFASIDYRLAPQYTFPAPVLDAARAVQFLRFRSKDWNIDAGRIAIIGESAGGCSAMWVLFHDDLGNPSAVDPIERQSTRVKGAAISIGQSVIDPPTLVKLVGPRVTGHPMLWRVFGEPSSESVRTNYARFRSLFQEFSPLNHMDSNDPPLFLSFGSNLDLPATSLKDAIHHPILGIKLQQRARKIGYNCFLSIPGMINDQRFNNSGSRFLVSLLTTPATNLLAHNFSSR